MMDPTANRMPSTLPPGSLIRRLDSITKPIPLSDWFTSPRPMEVELGSGDGSFLAAWAALKRDTNFLGVERLLGRLKKLDRKSRRAGLDNVSLLRIEGSYLLEYLLPSKAIRGIHIYFPDPWPKRRHWKNRLVNERFPALAARPLAEGGVVYLRTDNLPYFEQMTEVFSASPLFEKIETPAELAAVVTDFERHFNSQGVATQRAAYQLKS